ncbi:MAG: aldo/keto reductase, partial [Alphaproteobacteria bacterium]
MQYIQHQGQKIPALGFGTWQIKGEDCVQSVQKALDIGYRHIDTAQAYENELDVGKALDQHDVERKNVFLTTKIWIENFEPEKFMKSLDESLNKLQTDYVDMLLVHWPSEEHDMDTTLHTLVKAPKAYRHSRFVICS